MATGKIPLNDMYVGKRFADVDARTTFANMKCASGKTIDITISNGFRGLMTVMSASTTDHGKGLFFVASDTSGNASAFSVHASTDISVTGSSNTLTLVNSSTNLVNINILISAGNVNNAVIRTT